MEKKINVIFRIRKDQTQESRLFPIYLRVTIEGSRFEWSTQRCVAESKWASSAGRVKGTNEDARTINEYLDLLKHKVYVYQRELVLEQKELTIHTFKAKWLGQEDSGKMILEVFQRHNKKMEKLVGKDFAEGTLGRYRISYEHTQKFIKWKYNVDDLSISKLDYDFMSDYEFWLKTVRNCAQNTTI